MTTSEGADRTALAINRADIAEDRTLPANERTFSGWARTSMASIGIGIGFNALFKPVEPDRAACSRCCSPAPVLCHTGGYQTNMLIMPTGDYKFGDYTGTSVPLVAIMIVTLSTILVFRYILY